MPRAALCFAALAVPAWADENTPYLINPCIDASKPFAKMPWCDHTQPVDARVKDMLSRMPLQEKIGALGNEEAAIPSLGLPSYNWWSEATHGVGTMRLGDSKTPFVTSFAFPITTGMSFNRSMWQKTGGQIGREARAVMNAGNAWSTFWAPVVNLAREPRWGRNIETPGEDPYLSGEYATAFVKGFQESPDDLGHLQASACCKHYIANEMDNSWEAGKQWDRNHFDANVTMQDLVDSYMPPFQACVEKGRVSSLMCSYNAVNGVPSCANDWLLQDVARDAWGFDGYITSDCDADSDVFNSHHYTKTAEESVRDVLRAGTDSDCGGFVQKNIGSAMKKGLVTEADIDARLAMLFKVRMRLSHFDPVGPLDKIPTSDICSDYSKELARDGVAQSAALLKNDGTLPLKASDVESMAVIGPNANQKREITTYYGPHNPCEGKYWNMTGAVEQYVSKVVTVAGLPSVMSGDTSHIADAAQAASGVDRVVLALGTDLDAAREGKDATEVSLPAGQEALLQAVLKVAKKPVIVVLLTAVPLDISAMLSEPKIGAVIHLGQPNVQVLGAGDVIFGKKAPAGRLIQMIYPASYTAQISIFDFNMRPGPSDWPRPDCPKSQFGKCPKGTNPGRTHRFYTGTPVLPFGFGLSYTTFKYEVAQFPASIALAPLQSLLKAAKKGFVSFADEAQAGSPAKYSVTVTNTGKVDSDEVVLGFLVPPGAGKDGVPLQSLFAFERVHVPAGESRTVNLYPAWTDFSHVDAAGQRRALAGSYKVRFGLQWAGADLGFAEVGLDTVLEEVLI